MDMNNAALWESVYKVARYSATRCARIHRNLVSVDDYFFHAIYPARVC